MKQRNFPRPSALFSWLRSGLTGILGLLFLIVLSVVLVWPLWYLATSHTYLYSMALLVAAGGFFGFMVFARMRKVFRNAGWKDMSHARSVLPHPEPGEPAE
ncbi:MAG: hypothetical protein AB7T74_01240 [Clostridia bacterium]